MRKCQHKETKQLRAVKIINKKALEDEDKEKLINEIQILRKIVTYRDSWRSGPPQHPEIVRVFPGRKALLSGNWVSLDFSIFSLCFGGELFDKITEEQYFSEKDAAHIMRQVISSLNYIHTAGIMHRDLKPENLLLEKDEDNPKIKIIDFGTACEYTSGTWLS